MEDSLLLTDPSILYLLRCGEEIHRLIDPEGITRKGFVSNLFLLAPSEDGNIVWCVKLLFDSGDILTLNGVYSDNFKCLIESCKFKPFLNKEISFGEKPGNSLICFFGDLSELPESLKHNLSPISSKMEKVVDRRNHFNASTFTIAMNALFCSVDGGKFDDLIRQNFGSIKFSFLQGKDGLPYSAELSSILGITNGKITVSTMVDVYGLNRKAVFLEVKQSDGGIISSKCSKKISEKIVPSVKIAFELLAKFSDCFKTNQHCQKLYMGTPKFK